MMKKGGIFPILVAGVGVMFLSGKKKKSSSSTSGDSSSTSPSGSGSQGGQGGGSGYQIVDLGFVPSRDEANVRSYLARTINDVGIASIQGLSNSEYQKFAVEVCDAVFPHFPDTVAKAGESLKKLDSDWTRSIWSNVSRIMSEMTGRPVPPLVASLTL